jgi:hypothetical protein
MGQKWGQEESLNRVKYWALYTTVACDKIPALMVGNLNTVTLRIQMILLTIGLPCVRYGNWN